MIFGGNFKFNYLGIVLLIKVHLFLNEVRVLVPCFDGLHSLCTYNSYHSFLKSKIIMKVLFSFLQDSNLWFSPYVPNHGLNPQ
jgi:hypothetical protein